MHHPEHQHPDFDKMIGPRVLHLSKMMKIYCNEAFAEEGLFSGQQHILFNLMENEGMTLTELAKALGVATATASISVKRMEKSGFIVRKSDLSDARITRLYLTEKGKSAPKNVKRKMDYLEEVFKRGISEEEFELVSVLLDRAIENFIKEREEMSQC